MRRFHRFAWFVLAYTLGVILWGAYVRATGSGAGCGEHWPACNGVVIPRAPTTATVIEFTHRLTSGLALAFTVVLFFWGRRLYPAGHPVRRGVSLSLTFMITEALVGAGLVLFALVAKDASLARALGMSVHLVNTFLLVGALTLTTRWAAGAERLRFKRQGGVLWLLAASTLGILVLGISGAIAALGDTLFPAASVAEGIAQDLSPTAHVLLRLRVLHPVLAVGVGALVVAGGLAVARARPSRRVRHAARGLAGVYGLQLVAGFANVLLLAPVWMQLIHLLLADVVWILFVRLCAGALALSAPRLALRWDEPEPSAALAQPETPRHQ